MLYNIVRPFAKIALGLYFRKIYIANREAIPDDKPVILAANHPTAFIEPCILACWLVQPLSFIARGDLYVNSLILRKISDQHFFLILKIMLFGAVIRLLKLILF